MISLLSRVLAAVRVWVGLNDPAENRLHPSHGWLLPSPAPHALSPAEVLSPAPVPARGRRR
jgi:hypothetical protein